ncbi:hypothetical protein ACFY2Q_18580 [Micromonospora sp. NPDC000316]|uniref:hypothetical protein n=1 Tax=Micromonospora sp. NPDC000316 TaxID=3364216 RepID=UPI0036A4572E
MGGAITPVVASAQTEVFPAVRPSTVDQVGPDAGTGRPTVAPPTPAPGEPTTQAWAPPSDAGRTPTTPISDGYASPAATAPRPWAPSGPAATYPPPTVPAPRPSPEQHPHHRGYASQPHSTAPEPHTALEPYTAPEPHTVPGQRPYPGQQYQYQYPGQGHPQDGYPSAYPEGGSSGRGRGMLIGAAVAAVVAVVAVVGLGAVLLNRDDPPPSGSATAAAPTTATAPTAAGPAPGDLALRDDSATITLSWTDPSGGAVPFMIAGGRAGQALGVLATVDPGRTSYTVSGLNSRVDYCFTVLAVYSTDSFATSGQVCTERERSSPPS